MNTKLKKIGAALLAALMLAGTLASCANSGDTDDTTPDTSSQSSADSGTEAESEDPNKEANDALAALGDFSYGNRELGIIYNSTKNEIEGINGQVDASGGTAQVINDAVYKRNTILEDTYKIQLGFIDGGSGIGQKVSNESMAPSGDFVFIDDRLESTATSYSVNGFLANWLDLGIELDGPWWDKGTADFMLADSVFFMSGSLNFYDDNVTYVLLFNKSMQKTYANTVPNPYETVRADEWTLDHFNTIIQGISQDNAAPTGTWDEKDTYGFIATWEYGNTFFLGADLRYIINDDTVDEPSLYLANSGNMEKALNVLELAQSVYHDNHATYMSPAGEEDKGYAAFKENRGLFYGEVVSYIGELNRSMDGDYGVVPIPKYDKTQEHYRTWTHESGSTFSITSSVSADDYEIIGKIMSAYAVLSHLHVKTAYYDTMLTSRNMRDADSAEMMDLIFQNRVYDMGFYFKTQFGFYDVFKSAVLKNDSTFSSSYNSAIGTGGKKFDRAVNALLLQLEGKQ